MRVAFVFAWWLALAGWWLLLAGTNAGLELVAAACAGVLGTALAFGARRQRLLRFRFQARWRATARPAAVLKEVRSGVVGDYVAWLTFAQRHSAG